MIRRLLTTTLVILLVAWAAVAVAQDDARPFIGIGFAPDGASGISVTQVVPDSPAEAAELEEGDVIVLLDDSIVSAENLSDLLGDYSIGDTIALDVLRDDETITLELTLGERPPEPEEPESEGTEEAGATEEAEAPRRAQLGISVGDADDDSGAVVLNVSGGSPAAEAGIANLDVITTFDGELVTNADELIELVRTYEPGDSVEVELLRGEDTLTVEVTLGEAAQPGEAVMAPVPDGVTFNSDDNTWSITGDELTEFGLEEGDLITAINGEAIETPMDAFELLQDAILGDEPTLTVERGDETLEVEVPIPVVMALVAAVE